MNANLKLHYKLNTYLSVSRFSSNYRRMKYQFLPISITPTYHFQKSLPRLPIPSLDKTIERYLQAQKPLLSSSAYQQTEKFAQSFLSNEGQTLQKELIAQDIQNKDTSYISKLWFNMYLCDRRPLPINYNPCLVFTDHQNPTYNEQLVKTTNLLISSLRFYKCLTRELLEPDVFYMKKMNDYFFKRFTSFLPSSISWYGAYLFNAFPLDMSQYSSLFCSTRLPKKGRDELYVGPQRKHVVVLRKGHFYVFDAFNKLNEIKPPNVLYSYLDCILNDDTEAASHPLGLLTTGERDKWAEIRKELVENGNSAELDKIDTAILAIALDDVILKEPQDIVRWFLHSDGKNRWFDKSFTLITTASGHAGLNFEHAWGDGVAVLRYFTDIYNDSNEHQFVSPDTDKLPFLQEEKPRRLNFHINDKVKQEISDAKKKFDDHCKSLGVSAVIQQLGRDHCKKHQLSPDAVMQLIFQLAHYDLKKRNVPTYESCSTAAFKHGRTETVRPCTVETTEFCANVFSSSITDHEKIEMIKKCSKVHTELVKKAAMGQGFDRHLFALRKLAENKSEIPDIFRDPNYAYMNHNILSTSTLNSDLVRAGSFGPVVPDGYGIAYMIRKDTCGTVVTNYLNQTNLKQFTTSVEKSIETVKDLLTK